MTVSACSDNPPQGPSSTAPRVTAIAPVTGSTLGDTPVTITGANFSGVPTVSIGGAVAREVVVVSSGSIAATTTRHEAGIADVVVTVAGESATLASAFTYVVPPPTQNPPPVITALTAQGSRSKEPSQFADLNEEIDVTASVTDAETPIDQLQFEWGADAGTFAGSGPPVRWRAPAAYTTPASITLTLTVVETYRGIDASGQPAMLQNRTTGTVVVNVHDSPREIGAMATQFLTDFSKQLPVDVVLKNFMDCQGRADEASDIKNNQEKYVITSYELGPATAQVDFGGVCSFRNREGDGCAQVRARWVSTIKATGAVQTSTGVDQMTAFYRRPRWWLCDSDFDGVNTLGLRFMK